MTVASRTTINTRVGHDAHVAALGLIEKAQDRAHEPGAPAPQSLTRDQLDGRACVACGAKPSGMSPAGFINGSQVFECWPQCQPRAAHATDAQDVLVPHRPRCCGKPTVEAIWGLGGDAVAFVTVWCSACDTALLTLDPPSARNTLPYVGKLRSQDGVR